MMSLAALEAMCDRLHLAEEHLAAALPRSGPRYPFLDTAHALIEGVVELARARRAAADGHEAEAARWHASARRRLASRAELQVIAVGELELLVEVVGAPGAAGAADVHADGRVAVDRGDERAGVVRGVAEDRDLRAGPEQI